MLLTYSFRLTYIIVWFKMDMKQIEELREIVHECLLLSYDVNDLLDEKNDEVINKVGKIISNLELGLDIL